jgi:outer membrane protein
MNRIQTIAVSVGAAMLLAVGAAQAQNNYKIGFVNLQAIIQNAPQLQGLNVVLRDEFASRVSGLQEMQDDFNEKRETYERDAEVMSEGDRLALERELTQMGRDLERRDQELQEDLQIRQQEMVNELQIEIVEKIQAWAELNDYDLIVTDAVFVSQAVDVSAQVFEAIAQSVGATTAPVAEDAEDD